MADDTADDTAQPATQRPTSAQRVKIGWVCDLNEASLEGRTPRYREVQQMAQEAEQAGLDSFWVADHFFYQPPEEGSELNGQWEAFTFLAALAATTSRIALGPMVAATSFRNPTLLAKMADSLDEISDGRFILGIGAGWHKPEYDAFGYPFDHLAARFEEAAQIIVPLLREGTVNFQGRYASAENCVLRPRGPSPHGPRLLIGARRPRMLRLVARYADAWNTAWHTKPEVVAERWAEMKSVCAEVGRDPATLELTCGVLLNVALPGEERPAGDAQHITGTPEEIAAALRGFIAVGVQHFIFVMEPLRRDAPERLARVAELLGRG
jgi:alkanesulfonate monooxygenase SsuD/methylene tetrahydromethanopterin reductase-like flavin-dependent oxidoreductase (luciferase family)